MKRFLRVYDFLASHKGLYWVGLLLCFVLCGLAAVSLNYKEDISEFLPLDSQQKKSMAYYQQISRAEQIVIIFEGGETDTKLDAVDHFAQLAAEQDSVIANHLMTQIDVQQYMDILQWVYQHMPYFLTEADYERIDSLLASPEVVEQGVTDCQRMMQLPVSGFMRHSISADPLSLFSPVVQSLQEFQPESNRFASMDGYMLTGDEQMAFAFCQSPYGASETQHNARLVHGLEKLCEQVQTAYPEVSVRLLGAPVISVENASCIKKDSLLAVGLALLLITTILIYCFRGDLRAIPLILLTIGFGWLFAMTVMWLAFGGVSIIVLGIGSIIIGIAVNYPLHILFHQRYTSSTRQTLQEVINPLVIGNITTVAAFMALIPLDAVALRDLGVFAASMLVGTILFTIFFLPHLMKQPKALKEAEESLPAPKTSIKPLWRYVAISGIVVVTVLFWFIGHDLSFDADMTHINYMTDQQRADVAYFTSLADEIGSADIYVVEPQQEATCPDLFAQDSAVSAVHSPWRWLPSEKEQQMRLEQWNAFWCKRAENLSEQLKREAEKQGFSQNAFEPFQNLLTSEWEVLLFEAFRPLAEQVLTGYWMEDGTSVTLITRVSVPKEQIPSAEQRLKGIPASEHSNVFDIYSLNASLANRLSDSFDYIGIVCSLLVFFFLWISFRSLKVAFVAFLPMAVSWVWIIGIMHLLGLQFNIVNVILATFIFGQGDDYTIFVVEGLQYEHETGKRMLPQFRRSIILSAVIMFAGIGVLVVARHPAMFSLGAVTLIGMGVVVLMANIIPPLLRKLLYKKTK